MTDLPCLSDLPLLFGTLNISQLPTKQQQLIAQIDAILPQTQCGLCGHIDGCLPYAHGIVVHHEAHNLCVPGGQAVTDSIYQLLNRPPAVAQPSKWPTDPASNRPIEMLAIINEDDCIGCTKCIPACPVDAIVGSAKHMHTIIADLCTGCELCLAPCPVDCISLVTSPTPTKEQERPHKQAHLRHRYHHHLNRVAKNITEGTKPVVNAIESVMTNHLNQQDTPIQNHISQDVAKNTIELAKIRTQIKKLNKQLASKNDDNLRKQLDTLTQKLHTLQSQ